MIKLVSKRPGVHVFKVQFPPNRGCTLHIEYTDGEELVKIGKIKCDPHLPSTSILYLRLSRASGPPKNTNPLLRLVLVFIDERLVVMNVIFIYG